MGGRSSYMQLPLLLLLLLLLLLPPPVPPLLLPLLLLLLTEETVDRPVQRKGVDRERCYRVGGLQLERDAGLV